MTEVLPPYYAGWGAKRDYHAGGAYFDTILDFSVNLTGEMYTLNQNYILYAGDNAYQLTETSADMQIAFQSGVTGSLRIVATLENLESYYNGSLINESGVSGCSINQWSQLLMWISGVIGGNTQIYNLGDYGISYAPWFSHSWHERIAEPGEVRQYEFLPNKTFTAGEWVVMQLEIFDYQKGWVNDVKFSGNITNYWILRSLDVTAP